MIRHTHMFLLFVVVMGSDPEGMYGALFETCDRYKYLHLNTVLLFPGWKMRQQQKVACEICVECHAVIAICGLDIRL